MSENDFTKLVSALESLEIEALTPDQQKQILRLATAKLYKSTLAICEKEVLSHLKVMIALL